MNLWNRILNVFRDEKLESFLRGVRVSALGGAAAFVASYSAGHPEAWWAVVLTVLLQNLVNGGRLAAKPETQS